MFVEILNIVLPVFIVIALGYLLRHLELINAAFLFQTNHEALRRHPQRLTCAARGRDSGSFAGTPCGNCHLHRGRTRGKGR